MTELPERIVTRHYKNGIINARPAEEGFTFGPGNEVATAEFLRADTVIPKSVADAIMAAALHAVGESIIKATLDTNEGRNIVETCVAAYTPADARAAFDQTVREAVAAERERCVQVALCHFGYEPSDEEMHTVMDIAAAIRAQQEPNE